MSNLYGHEDMNHSSFLNQNFNFPPALTDEIAKIWTMIVVLHNADFFEAKNKSFENPGLKYTISNTRKIV